jgi:signal transduction histidine kinase
MSHSGHDTAARAWDLRAGNDENVNTDKVRNPWQRGLELKAAVMPPKTLSLLARYGLAIALVVMALGLDLVSKSVLGETATGLFILAAMVSAWYGGMGPGIVAVLAADLCNTVFFYNPHFSLSMGIHGPKKVLLFSLSALLVSWLTTRKRRAEGELRKLNEELEQRVRNRTAALLESNNQLEEFCRTLAHDLRAPLRSMQGFAHLLLEENGRQLDADGRDYAQRISTSAERMGELLLDLLAYSQVSRAEYRLEKIDLTRVVENVFHKFADEIEMNRAVVSRKSSYPMIMGDRVTVENAITNLISNALKFRSPEKRPRVQIWTEEQFGQVRLWVGDNGIGIEPQYQERLFRVFERLHKKEAYTGTGIGLAMVKKGVERMGGQVGVESKLGEGSRFWIELPKA